MLATDLWQSLAEVTQLVSGDAHFTVTVTWLSLHSQVSGGEEDSHLAGRLLAPQIQVMIGDRDMECIPKISFQQESQM